MTLTSDAKFEEEPTCHCKNDKSNLAISMQAQESLKISTLMGFFYRKYINV